MKELSIKVIDQNKQVIDGLPSCWGEITIGSFKEKFVMPLSKWAIKDYESQWETGLEKIRHENQSCLITAYEYVEGRINPLVEWWVLYKIDAKIYIQNELLFGESYEEIVGDNVFDAQTCYNFIQPRRTHTEEGEKISEWTVNFENKQ